MQSSECLSFWKQLPGRASRAWLWDVGKGICVHSHGNGCRLPWNAWTLREKIVFVEG